MVAVLLWGAGFWFLTRPFHESWPVTLATVLRTHEFSARGEHCEVYLGIDAEGKSRTVMFSGYAPCSELPSIGDMVHVGVDPTDEGSVRMVGYDGPLWADIGLPAWMLALPIFWAAVNLLVQGVQFRRAHRVGGDRPWRAVTAMFVSRTLYRGAVTSRLMVMDSNNNERTVLLSGPMKDLPGFTFAKVGSTVTFWLVADGKGNILINQPGAGHATAGRAYVPNQFELRTMA